MLRRLGFIAVLVCVFGCDPAPDPVASPKPNKGPAPAKAPDTKPATTTKAVSNPNRIYQLADLQKASATLGSAKYDCWVMDTEPKRMEGMMFLEDAEVKDGQGMIFAFKDEQGPDAGFWMSHTLIPLDILYIDKSNKVIHIAHGKVEDETSLKPGAKYKMVIELKQGQADKNGIKEGTSVTVDASVQGKD